MYLKDLTRLQSVKSIRLTCITQRNHCEACCTQLLPTAPDDQRTCADDTDEKCEDCSKGLHLSGILFRSDRSAIWVWTVCPVFRKQGRKGVENQKIMGWKEHDIFSRNADLLRC